MKYLLPLLFLLLAGCAGVQVDYVKADRLTKEALELHIDAQVKVLPKEDAQSLRDVEETWELRLQAAEKSNKLTWDEATQSYKE